MFLNRLVLKYLERQLKKPLKTKTGEHVGKKAGDKIVQMLSKGEAPKTRLLKNPPTKKVTFNENVETIPSKKLTQKEINQRVNSILSGGKLYNY